MNKLPFQNTSKLIFKLVSFRKQIYVGRNRKSLINKTNDYILKTF